MPDRKDSSSTVSSVRLFSYGIKAIWIVLIILICTAELMPIRPMPSILFYLYEGLKAASFLALGFIPCLAFYRIRGIAVCIMVSIASAVLIEVFQSMSHNGHSFHLHELAEKLLLICVAFALSLDWRYEGRIPLGILSIRLHTSDL
jgi:hypothetical protein